MKPHDKFFLLLTIIAGLLLAASAIGRILRRRVTDDNARAVIENLNSRINAWWLMMGVFAISFLAGETATLILFSAISFLALREFLTITPTRAGDYRALSLAFFVLIPVQYLLIGIGWYGLFSIFIPVYAFLLLPSLTALAEDTEQFLERSAKIQWGVVVTIYCISYVPALLFLKIPHYPKQDALLVFYLLLVVQISDVLQYVFGKIYGKTRIAPTVSPSKTVAGFVGGGAMAVVIGTAMWWITPFTPWQAASMAFIIVLMGFLGGLVLSAVKRSLGAKDWGTLIKGHGGMLDRMDSVSFAAPVFFHLTRYFFTR